MKECDKRKIHIGSKLHMIYISSNNVRHPVTKTFTALHPTTLHFTTIVDTSLPLISTSPNYTSLPSHLKTSRKNVWNLNFQ
jgi:hypothetical protein